MPKDCSFVLKEPKSIAPTLIYCRVFLHDGKVKRSILKKILPTDWDPVLQRAAGTGKAAREVNQVIDAITGTLPGLKSECRRAGRVISCADVQAAIDVILQDKRTEKPGEAIPSGELKNMFDNMNDIVKGMKDGDIMTPGRNKKRYKHETIRNYEDRTLPKLKEFYNDKKLSPEWEVVDIEVYEQFISWCHKKDLSNNSIGVYVKCWRRFGQIALSKKWHSNPIFNDEEFLGLKEETDDIYLDESKIEKIYKQAVIIEHYDIARDWFVLDCYLGLRISDLKRIGQKDFAGKLFQFVNQKTGAHVAIPIHPYVKAIIKKWRGLPPAITEQKFREYIKQVAKLAKLNDKFIYRITKGGTLQVFEYQEWEMVSPHTCRRSFITNLLKLGEPHAHVMKLAGIKRYETLMRYFKQTPEEVAEEAGKRKFFKGK